MKRGWLVAIGLAVLLAAAAVLYLVARSGDPPPAGDQGKRPSESTSTRPSLADSSFTLKELADGDPGPTLTVRVTDVLGGPIAGAKVQAAAADGRPATVLGETGDDGELVTNSSALARTGPLHVSADGYARAETTFTAPGTTDVHLVPESTISGQTLDHETRQPVGGLEVSAGSLRTVSDESGRFTLTGVAAGLVRLEARGKGWHGETAGPLAAGVGSVLTNVVVPVHKAFAIRGTVLAGGTPLTTAAEISWSTDQRQRLDDRGRFEFNGLGAGRYTLMIAIGEGDDSFRTILAGRTEVTVATRDVEVEIDIGVTHSITFEVVDEDKKPLAGADILYELTWEGGLLGMSLTTGDDGRAVLAGLEEGRVLPYYANIGWLWSSPKAEVAVPAPGVVRIVAPRVGGLRGRVVRSDGSPASSRLVVLRRRGDSDDSDVEIDANGAFDFAMVPAGEFSLKVLPFDGSMMSRFNRDDEVDGEYQQTITIEAGRSKNVEIVVAGEEAQLIGRVVDSTGQPVVEALVTYEYATPHYAWSWFRPRVATTATDQDGRFSFDGLDKERRYRVIAFHPKSGQGMVRDHGPTDPATITLETPAALEVSPARAVRLVRDKATLAIAFAASDKKKHTFDSLPAGPIEIYPLWDDDDEQPPLATALLEAGKTTTVALSE